MCMRLPVYARVSLSRVFPSACMNIAGSEVSGHSWRRRPAQCRTTPSPGILLNPKNSNSTLHFAPGFRFVFCHFNSQIVCCPLSRLLNTATLRSGRAGMPIIVFNARARVCVCLRARLNITAKNGCSRADPCTSTQVRKLSCLTKLPCVCFRTLTPTCRPNYWRFAYDCIFL